MGLTAHNLSEDVHRAMYVQASDPGAVGARIFWLDTTAGDTIPTGAILKKRDTADTGWDTVLEAADLGGSGIAETLLDAKGDIIAATAADTAARVAIGQNGYALIAASAETPGLKWGMPGKIFDSTLGSSASGIDSGAASIPSGFDVLEVWLILRTDEAVAGSSCKILVNNDTGANYDRQNIRGVNTTASAAGGLGTTDGWTINIAGASCAAGVFSMVRMSIPAYAQTTAQKAMEFVNSRADTTIANCLVEIQAFNWRSTAAITRIAVNAPASQNFVTGSRMIVYGR
jgi:hypothetical protein